MGKYLFACVSIIAAAVLVAWLSNARHEPAVELQSPDHPRIASSAIQQELEELEFGSPRDIPEAEPSPAATVESPPAATVEPPSDPLVARAIERRDYLEEKYADASVEDVRALRKDFLDLYGATMEAIAMGQFEAGNYIETDNSSDMPQELSPLPGARTHTTSFAKSHADGSTTLCWVQFSLYSIPEEAMDVAVEYGFLAARAHKMGLPADADSVD